MWTCGRGFANFCSPLSPTRYYHCCLQQYQLLPPRRLHNPPGNLAHDSEIFKSSKTFLYFLFISPSSLLFSRRKVATSKRQPLPSPISLYKVETAVFVGSHGKDNQESRTLLPHYWVWNMRVGRKAYHLNVHSVQQK